MKVRSALVTSLVLLVSTLYAEDKLPAPVTPKPPEPPSAVTPTTLPDDTLEVRAKGDHYAPNQASTALKTDQAILLTPVSIQVVPEAVIKDRQSYRLDEALSNVSGVRMTSSPRSSQDFFNIRGMAGRRILVDGLEDTSFIIISAETFNLERVEVMKGPASVLYGRAEPGGLINLVTRKPERVASYNGSYTYGSYDLNRATIDLTGPLTAEGGISYRLGVGYHNSNSFVDYLENERLEVAPSLAFALGDSTTVILQAQIGKMDTPFDRGQPAAGTVLPNINGTLPISRFFGEPDFWENDRLRQRYAVLLEHRFDENWRWRTGFSATITDQESKTVNYGTLAVNQRTLARTAGHDLVDRDFYNLTNDLIGRFTTGSMVHDVLVGFDVHRDFLELQTETFAIASIDIFAPVYGADPGARTRNTDSSYLRQGGGVYVQDVISLTSQWKLMLGARGDWYYQKSINKITDVELTSDDKSVTPRAGLVYQVAEPFALYGSYSRSWIPIGAGTRSVSGETFDPEKAEQFEVGAKIDLASRVTGTLAVFQLTKQDVVVRDPANPGFSISVGEQRSRGIELDLAGEVLPGFQVIAAQAFMEAEVTEDPTIQEGNELDNVPRSQSSVWGVYTIANGPFAGLGFGAGVYYVTEVQANLANTYQLDAYARVDAAVYYQAGPHARLSLNVKNVLDEEYYNTAAGNFVYPGEPLTLLGTVAFDF